MPEAVENRFRFRADCCSSDLPEWFRGHTWMEPDLIILTRDGKIHPEYSAVKPTIGFPP